MKSSDCETFIEKYSKDEFCNIISLLPWEKLLEPIKKHSKEFRKEVAGFRIDNLPLEKVQSIYYIRVYKKNDLTTSRYTQKLIHEYLQVIDEEISREIETPQLVREKIENNDRECFDKLIDLLLVTKHRNDRLIYLYFKMIDFELNDEQKKYIDNDLEKRILLKKAESQIKEQLITVYEKQTREIEYKYNQRISDKESQIKLLEQKLKDQEKYYEFELSVREARFKELQEYKMQIEREMLSEKEVLNNEIYNLQLLLKNIEKENAEKESKIKTLSDVLEARYDEFKIIANKEWTKSNEELLQRRKEIESSIDDLLLNEEIILEEINSLNLVKSNLEDKIKSIENRAGDLLYNFRDILNALGYNQNQINKESTLLKVASVISQTEIENIDKKSYLIDDLTTNLNICGISNDYARDLSEYIYAILASNLGLLLVGYNTRKIADAISYIICGSSAEIITLPLGYNDCNELILEINTCKSKVVLIEDAVDNISESIYIPLIKQNTEKFLIFSMESSENLSILPLSILNYMMMVDIDTIISFENDSDLLCGVVNQEIFNIETNKSDKSTNLRHLNGLNKVLKLNNVTKLKLAEVMSIIDKLNSSNAMYDILLFSISMLCKCRNKIDELKAFIEKQEFNHTKHEILESILGEFYGEV